MSDNEMEPAWNVQKIRAEMARQEISVSWMIDEVFWRVDRADPHIAQAVLPGCVATAKNRWFLEPTGGRLYRGGGPHHPLVERVMEQILSAPKGAFRGPERRKKP